MAFGLFNQAAASNMQQRLNQPNEPILPLSRNTYTEEKISLLQVTLKSWSFIDATQNQPRTDIETTAAISDTGPLHEILEYDLNQLNGKSSMDRGLEGKKRESENERMSTSETESQSKIRRWSWDAHKKRLADAEQAVRGKWTTLAEKWKLRMTGKKRVAVEDEEEPPVHAPLAAVVTPPLQYHLG